ncbi:hypothetical protein KEM48_009689 [Puccinia striiformis f. sp. tritici PST-130]|nr:hypothetical protein KEM48_009689 [Puccinia striiformis f. sp. tritici PST-130]
MWTDSSSDSRTEKPSQPYKWKVYEVCPKKRQISEDCIRGLMCHSWKRSESSWISGASTTKRKKSVCWRETLVEFLGPASEKEKAEKSITRSVDKGNEEQSTGAAEAGEGTRIFNRDNFSFTSILEPFWDSRAENAVLRRSDKLSLGGESYHGEEGMLLKFNEREGMKIGSTSPHETCKSSEEKEFETARSGTEIINEEGRTDQAMQEEFLHQFRSLVLEDIPYPDLKKFTKRFLNMNSNNKQMNWANTDKY